MGRSIAIGTCAAIAAAAAMIWLSNGRFDRHTSEQIEVLLARGIPQGHVITDEDLVGLPSPVQRWLHASGIVGQPVPRTIRLRQEGEIRLGPDRPWMPFRADQYYTIDPVAFLWRVSATAAPGLFIRGVDKLQDGHGSMQMMPLALFKVVDAYGLSLDQGSALRYLQEVVWLPFAALSDAVTWDALDDAAARATLTLGTLTVSGVFVFDDVGHVLNFQALRYRDDASQMQPWSTPMSGHRTLAGVVVPCVGEGVWGSDESAFTYIRVRLTDLDYRVAETY